MPPADAQHWHRAVPAVQRLLEFAPSCGSLALWVQHRDVPAEDEETPRFGRTSAPLRPPVTTDGTHLYYARSFDALTPEQQAGAVAHGVLHIALRHVARRQALQAACGEVDGELFNLCADAIVNSTLSHLTWLELPTGALTLETLLGELFGIETTADAALAEWDVERLYRAVDDRRRSGPPRGGNDARLRSRGSGGSSGRGGDAGEATGTGEASSGQGASSSAKASADAGSAHADAQSRVAAAAVDGPRAARLRLLGRLQARDLLPGAGDTASPEAEAELARDWAERLLRAHAGDAALSLLRTLPADLPRSRTPWEQVLRMQLARGLSRRPTLSWSRPARSYLANQGRTHRGQRMPFEPGTSGTRQVPRLALVVDVSGSVDPALLARFACELAAITRRQESECVVVIGDNAVQQVVRCGPGEVDLAHLAPRGGGGTDFTPLLEEADRHRPDAVVVLTDLDGPVRYKPRAPVIWAVPGAGTTARAPFGRLLALR